MKLEKNHLDLSEKVQELYSITRELETAFPGRKFTLDGHLVGSIGEVLVADYYGLTLLPNSTKTHDAISGDGRMVQIKATQGKSVSISSEPDFAIVIKIHENGTWEEIYNGPGNLIWNNVGKMQKNGQRPISLARLKTLLPDIKKSDKITPLNREDL